MLEQVIWEIWEIKWEIKNYGDTLPFPHFIKKACAPFSVGRAFRPALCRPHGAAELSFQKIEKRRRAERTANRLGGADGGEVFRARAGRDEIGETAAGSLDQRPDRDQVVITRLEMRAHARPRPILRPACESPREPD